MACRAACDLEIRVAELERQLERQLEINLTLVERLYDQQVEGVSGHSTGPAGEARRQRRGLAPLPPAMAASVIEREQETRS
jgi:hypothetical protein